MGILYVVSSPIGNLEDITRRAARVLSEVDVIAAEDTRTTIKLLDHLGIRKPMVSYHNYNERQSAERMLSALAGGKSVALVTDAGTPGISDPAFALVRGAIERGVRVVPVPGPSALIPALVVSGLPTDRFVFEGFLPAKKGRLSRLRFLKEECRTIVLYESPHRIVRTLRDLMEHLDDPRVALARELTKKFEEVLRGRASEVLRMLEGRTVRGEITLVIEGKDPGKERNAGNTDKEDF